MNINDEVSSISSELESIYKDLHQHPELGYTEVRTAGIVAEYLQKCGLEVTTGVAMTGVVGILDSGRPGKTLMLRADMDCLAIQELSECEWKSKTPGQMHACGHDAHVTMLLGAAKILSRHKEDFSGKIKFVFQPAEEGIPAFMREKVREAGFAGNGGALWMIQEGVMEDVDNVIVLHVQPELPMGQVMISRRNAMASSDVFDITLVGKGGHGARPHTAVDPVPAMAELISAIHMLPTREVPPTETCVFSIGVAETPGSTWNAVAEKARIYGGFRTFNEELRIYLRKRVREIAEQIAAANRCTVEYSERIGHRPTLQNVDFAKQIADNLKSFLGDENVVYTETPSMTSEDAGAYLECAPGVFFFFGVGESENSAPLHNPHFRMNLNALAQGVALHLQNTLFVLNEQTAAK